MMLPYASVTPTGPFIRTGRRLAGLALILTLCVLCPGPWQGHARTAPTVALVLGGGAARGYSHIGVLQALEEAGVPIDIVVGTSMGSVIGGLYAAGLSTDNLVYLVTQVDLYGLFRPTFPLRGGLFDSQRGEALFAALTNNARIETLPIRFYSVVTDLASGQEAALNRGPLSTAILASMAIPGVFPPVEIDGRHYVDGGVVNLVPADVARAAGADIVIAVDVSQEIPEELDFHSIRSNIAMSIYAMMRGHTARHLAAADLVIEPDVGHESSLAYGAAERFIRAGYAAAQSALPDVYRLLEQADPDMTLPYRPPQAGIPADEFATFTDAAVERALTPRFGPRLRLRIGFHPDFRYQFGLGYTFGLAGREPGSSPHPLFAAVASEQGETPKQSYEALHLGFGFCEIGCGSLFWRRYRDGTSWTPGLRAQFRLNRTTTAWAEWDLVSPGNQGRLSFRSRWSSMHTGVERTYTFTVARDERGLYGRPDTAPFVEFAPEWRLPLGHGFDVWGVTWLRPAFLIGASVRAYFEDTTHGSRWEWSPEVGLGLESALFGLYPMRSRLTFSYHSYDDSWRWKLVFGD